MPLSPKLTYEDFCNVADKLYYEQREMPTAAKTHNLIGHGSLQTHQHYLNKWREAGKKPDTLPEQLARKIKEETLKHVSKIWKVMEETAHEKNQKIQQDAKQTIERVEAEAKESAVAKQKSEEKLKALEVQYQALQQEHKEIVGNFSLAEKRGVALEEKNKALDQQLQDFKTEAAQQIKYFKEQDQKNRELFKEQLNEQEQKYEHRYLALQKEKNTEKANAENTIDEMKAEQNDLQVKFFDRQAEIEKSKTEVHHLKQLLNKIETEKKTHFEECQKLKVDLQKKEHQISHVQGENHLLQQQLKECQKKVITLQEEILQARKLKKNDGKNKKE